MWRWMGDRWKPIAVTTGPVRSGVLLASNPYGRGLLMFGGSVQRQTDPSCPSHLKSGQACTGTIEPDRPLSDTWAFSGGVWRRLAPDGVPQSGQLMASDPALGTAVLIGYSRYGDTSGVLGTWRWTGHRWALLSPAPVGLVGGSLGYDPVSRRLLAYRGEEPFTAGPGMGVRNSPGFSRTWSLEGRRWVEQRSVTAPDRASGILTRTPDGHRLLLINTRGQTWTWTGRDWQRLPTRGGPTGTRAAWTHSMLSAAPDPAHSQVVLLATSANADDQTWTLHGGTWTRHTNIP
jgi:hypothetical protein